MKEADDLNKYIVKFLNLHGWHVRRVNTIHVRGRAMPEDQQGYGDVQGCSDKGLYVNIEGKANGDKLRPLQNNRIAEINQRRGIAFIAWSKDDFEEKIKPWITVPLHQFSDQE